MMTMALTESAVITSAQKHFPLIQASVADLQKAEGDYLSAKGGFDPKINSQLIVSPNGFYQNGFSNTELTIPVNDSGNNFFTGYRIGRGEFPVYDQERETYNLGEIKMGVELPLLRNHKIDDRRANIQTGKLNTELNMTTLQLIKLQTVRDASINYWIWYAEGKKLFIQKHILELAVNRQKMLEHSVSSGDLPHIDLVDNQRIIMQREASYTQQKALFQKASFMLSFFYRDNHGKPLIPDLSAIPNASPIHKFHEPMNPQVLEAHIDEHPELERLKKQRLLSMVELDKANNNLLPILNNRIYVAQDFGGGNPPLNRTSINYQLVFEFPIFQREAKGQIIAAEKLLEKNAHEQTLQHDKLMIQIQSALNDIHQAERVIQYTEQEIKMAYRVEEAENIKFKHGDSNLFLLNERELATTEAQLRYMDAIRNYCIAIAELRFASNTKYA
jgi:outer membrane protein, heavy metal efflux system